MKTEDVKIPGWYWWRFGKNHPWSIMQVRHEEKDQPLQAKGVGGYWRFIIKFEGEWFGPIEEPKE